VPTGILLKRQHNRVMLKGKPWRLGTIVASALVLILAIAQGASYYSKLVLSLGPRVILQTWLVRQGYWLYEQIADEHMPLMTIILRAARGFAPDELLSAKLVLAVTIGVTTLLVFWAGSRTRSVGTGLLAALFFALWSPAFGYGKLWHETFLAPLYISLLIVWRPPRRHIARMRSFLLAGLILGLAILIKQHALFVLGGFLAWELFVGLRAGRPGRVMLREQGAVLLAAGLPVAAYAGYHLARAGSLADFWFWTVSFSRNNNYTRLAFALPRADQLRLLAPAYLLLLPFLAQTLVLREKHDPFGALRGWACVLLFTSSLTAFPRFGTFHLQASLPILAWISATALTSLPELWHSARLKRSHAQVMSLAWTASFVLLWGIQSGLAYYWSWQNDAPQEIMEYSPLMPVAQELRAYVGETDSLYLLPDDEGIANLYYLLRRQPPEPWIPTSYPWFMSEELSGTALASLQRTPPRWVVYFPGRWGIEQHGGALVQYVGEHYRPVAHLSWTEGEIQLLQYQP
jgi:hypothetical protein